MVCTYNTCDEHSQHFQDFHARALNGHETIGFRKPESSANFTFLRSRSTSQRWAEHGAEANPAIPKRYVGAYDSLRFSDNVQRREVTPKSISSRIVLRSSLQHTRRIVRRRPHVRRRETIHFECTFGRFRASSAALGFARNDRHAPRFQNAGTPRSRSLIRLLRGDSAILSDRSFTIALFEPSRVMRH